MAILEVIMICWSLYTTVRYFLAYSVYPSNTSGKAVAIVLAIVSTVSFTVLFAAVVIPLLQLYLLSRNFSIEALLQTRMVLRYMSSFFVSSTTIVNFALTFAWRASPDPALDLRNRCDLDIDVVWSIRSHPACSPPPWGGFLALSIVRLLVTLGILTIYHLSLSSYRHIRRPSQSRHRPSSSVSESTYLNSSSPPMSGSGSPLPQSHQHKISVSTLGSNSRQTLERRSLRSSRGSSMHLYSPSAPDPARLPRMNDSPRSSHEGHLQQEEFDPYANIPPLASQTETAGPSQTTESDRELYRFVDRFRSLVSQISREAEEAAYFSTDGGSSSESGSSPSESTLPTDAAFRAVAPAVGYDEFGRPYPPDDHVRILNSYIRRMPTIESIGSREWTASTSIAASSLYQEQLASLHSLSRPPTRAMTDGASEPPSRPGSLSLAAVELISVMGVTPEGLAELGELVGRVRRAGSVGSAGSHSGGTAGTGASASTVSYYTATNASPVENPISEEGPQLPPLALRPLPRPPLAPRAESL
ncbi:hypothetical protein B0H10DRAFT_569385 [Mycena sp. CBHHK59/15]|nr:hypothetical protein B0H10DRAFT_569385 [Mycena sp. CBHHK59/15]